MKIKIYLIINEKIISQTLLEFLINLNYEVSKLNSTSYLPEMLKSVPGSQALVIIEENMFMGEGKSIIKKIHRQFSDTYFVIITGSTPDFTINEALSYGIYGYLHTPISLVELELLLIRFTGKKTE